MPYEEILIDTDSLFLKGSLVPWDTDVFHYPVGQIEALKVNDLSEAKHDYKSFRDWYTLQRCGLISCRLDSAMLRESIFLEEWGFRFIEMVLHPKIDNIIDLVIPDQGLDIEPATVNDLEQLTEIAENSFRFERFHIDPRIDSRIGNIRYGRWVSNVLYHSKQRLLKVTDNDNIVGCFIIETDEAGKVYWHLTAIHPDYRGRGYGRRTWLAMLRWHRDTGLRSVSTTISARNTPVLNLYSSLNFRFSTPDMTFHLLNKE